MNQKGFSAATLIIVVGILVFAGAVGVRYLTKKAPDETANWKTYQNENFGFEFRYPSAGWHLQEKANTPGTLQHEFAIEFISETGKDYWPFGLRIYDCTKLSSDWQLQLCSPEFFTQPNYDFKESFINGKKAYSREWLPGSEAPLPVVKQFQILRNNLVYIIEQSKDAESRGAFIIDKVVSTLKFE